MGSTEATPSYVMISLMQGDRPETRYVAVGDIEVAYQVVGDGPIDLVYHHGFCHLDLQWDVLAEAAFNERLASFSRLILFDRRGTGASERLARGGYPTMEEWIRTPEVVTSGSYHSLRYVSLGVGFPNDVGCGAEVFYTTAG